MDKKRTVQVMVAVAAVGAAVTLGALQRVAAQRRGRAERSRNCTT